MSKRIRNLIMLGVLFALAIVGIVVLVLLGDDPTDTQQQTPTKPSTQASDTVIVQSNSKPTGTKPTASESESVDVTSSDSPVSSVTVTNEYGSYVLCPREVDGMHAVKDYHDLPRDAEAISAVLQDLSYLTAAAQPEKTESDEAYGFAQPSSTVAVTYTDGSSYTLEIGIESKGTSGYYCRILGNDNLYILATDTANQFLCHGKEYIGKTLIAPPAVEEGDEEGAVALFDMTLTGSCREEPIVVTTDTDAKYPDLAIVSTYYLQSPFLRAVDSDAFSTQATTMLTLKAAGVECPHPTKEDLEKYGLTENAYSIANFTLSVTSGKAAEDGKGTIVSHYNDRKHMVVLGNKNEDGSYYALVDGYEVVYLLSPASVPWAEQQFYDLVGKNIFIKMIDTIETFTVTENGTTTVFELKHDPDNEHYSRRIRTFVGDKEYSSDDFRTLYQTLLRVKRVAPKDASAVASGDPVLRVQIQFNDGSEDLDYAMYAMSGSRYLMVTQDGEEVAVSVQDVKNFIEQCRNYLAGLQVKDPY